MKYELKKLLFRTETLVLLVLGLIALAVLGMRGSNSDKEHARLTREITAQYAGIPDTEAAKLLKQEMETAADTGQYNIMHTLLHSAAQFRARRTNRRTNPKMEK